MLTLLNQNIQNRQKTEEIIIKCSQLTKIFPGNILAIDHVYLTIYREEIFGLLGPNGAGKTTTIGMLTTLVIPSSGKAIVTGSDVMKHPALVKQVIGVVSQSNNLDRSLTVWENLYYHGHFLVSVQKMPGRLLIKLWKNSICQKSTSRS